MKRLRSAQCEERRKMKGRGGCMAQSLELEEKKRKDKRGGAARVKW